MRTIRIGLLGLGQIGGGLYSILSQKRNFFAQELGLSFEIVKIAVRTKNKKRSVRVPASLLTLNPMDVVRDPRVDILVELIGGVKEAKTYVMEALRRGKHVVTANKALLAEEGDEIFELAQKMKRWIFFEASVAGGIPVIKALREGLAANKIESIHSIINGTSNYILTRMTEDKMDFKEALVLAQQKGYAEKDPTLDIEGIDAAHKLAVLTRFAFGGKVNFKDLYAEGISSIRSEDIAFAEEFGYRIKLLAIAKAGKDGVEARVQPTLLPKSHILSNVNGSFNAVLLRGDEVGDVLLYGRGAGSHPTASAVVSDLIDVALRQSVRFENDCTLRAIRKTIKIKKISSIQSRYYLRFHVVDRPGVLAKIAQALGKHSISISDVFQKESSVGSVVPLILLTHPAHEHDVRSAIANIGKLKVSRGQAQVLRIEENHNG